MTVLTVDCTEAAVNSAIANAKPGDVVKVKPGTLLLQKPLVELKTPFFSFLGDGLVTVRQPLKPHTWSKMPQAMAAMNAMGIAGEYEVLGTAKQAEVQKYITDHPTLDVSGAVAAIQKLFATPAFAPITGGRMWDAKPPRRGTVTFNGVDYLVHVAWGTGQSKGTFTTYYHANSPTDIIRVWGTFIEGFIWQNARMEGSSNNASAIRSQGGDVWAQYNTFQDCEGGVFGTTPQTIANPNGAWFDEDDQLRYDMFGFNVTKKNTFDDCGSGGNAHHIYNGHAVRNVSLFDHVIRSNNCNGIKHNYGAQFVIGSTVDDTTDSGGLVAAIDLDSGVGYILNTTTTKRSAGGGTNYGPVLQMRNDRTPNPASMPLRAVMVGNVVTSDLAHKTNFILVPNAPNWHSGSAWSGVPAPFAGGIIKNNVLCAKPGAAVRLTPIIVPANFEVSNNPIIDIGAAIPDLRVTLPNYECTRANLNDYLAEVVATVDPNGPGVIPVLRGQTYPSGITAIYLESGAAPSTPGPVVTPDPVTQPPAQSDAQIIATFRQQLVDAAAATKAAEGLAANLELDVTAANNARQKAQDALAAANADKQSIQQALDAANKELAVVKANVLANVADARKELDEIAQEAGG